MPSILQGPADGESNKSYAQPSQNLKKFLYSKMFTYELLLCSHIVLDTTNPVVMQFIRANS